MRRAAVQAFRTARRSPVRKLLGLRGLPVSAAYQTLGLRSASSSSRKDARPVTSSSMYFRNFSLALVSTLVATGGWYAYKATPASSSGGSVNSTTTAPGGSVSTATRQAPAFAFTSAAAVSPLREPDGAEQVSGSTRRALVVDNDQFYTGELVGDAPLSKDSDYAGRKVLEMLTPEQATERIRKSEESYLVGRGRGVVRYDVVQLPSNNPIEDDHAERIVEVPQTVAATQDGTSSSDWMFWGVFDGHR